MSKIFSNPSIKTILTLNHFMWANYLDFLHYYNGNCPNNSSRNIPNDENNPNNSSTNIP